MNILRSVIFLRERETKYKMFQVAKEEFGLPESELSDDWRQLAKTVLSEEEEQNDVKIFSLRKSVLNQEDLGGFHDSELLQNNGFLLRSILVFLSVDKMF